MANIAKLEELQGVLEANPKRHDQNWWAWKTECGTVMCAAGWTVELWGSGIDWFRLDNHGTAATKLGRAIMSEAREILELTEYEAYDLFIKSSTLEDVKMTIKEIANG